MSENAQVYVSTNSGWTLFGETDGPIRLEAFGFDHDDVSQPFRLPSLTITVDATGTNEALAQLYRMIHDVDRLHHPRRHGHCPTCHPEQDRRPLAVDGHEYNRRRKARIRRKRGR